MFKKLSSLFIIFLIVLSLAGCASGGYEISQYSDGRILESFYVTLNQNAIELAGYDYQEVEQEVFDKFLEVRNNLATNFTNADNGLNIFQKEQFINEHIRVPSIENKTIGVSFLFDNYDDYKLFYNIVDEGEEPENKTVEDKIFFIKTTTTTATVFKNTQSSSLADELLAYFSDPLNGNIIYDFSDIDFSYSYATKSSKLRSNADRTFYTSGGLKVHSWDVPQNNYDFEIEFYEYQIVSTWWYVLALALTFVFIIAVVARHRYEIIIETKAKKVQENLPNDLKE
jgi:hypothetical protein